MNIFQKIKRVLNLSLTDPKSWNPSLWNLIGSQSLSGENVTEHTALTYSAVWNAVDQISGDIAALPLHLMQKKGDKKKIADDRRIYRVMHDQANEFMTAMAFRKTMMSHILTWGNGYAEILRDGYGEVSALWPITPNRVRIEIDGNARPIYKIAMDAETITLPRERVLHITGPSFDGFVGYSVIGMARKSIGLGMALETFGALYFGQGTHPGVVVSHPGQLSATANDNLKKSLTEGYSGLGKSHRLLLLEEGMKLEKLGIPPNDSQFLESRIFQIQEVARWFNMPPHKIKELSKSSFNNIEQENGSYYAGTILPFLVLLEQNYNMQLLSVSDRNLTGYGRLYFKHNADGILRASAADRAKFYSTMFGIGAMSINEIRALEDMDPVEGGDIHLVPLNMTTLENAGKQPEPVAKELPTPEPDKDNGGKDDEEMV